jgi:hypothetical protein
MSLILERCFPSSHLKTQYTDAPNIHPIIIGLTDYNLRWDVIKSTAECLSWLLGWIHTPTEVKQLQHSIVEQNILWLYISMNDTMLVQVR